MSEELGSRAAQTRESAQRTADIRHFFHWFRQRHANIVALSTIVPPAFEGAPTSFLPEQLLLVGAEIDALANHWRAALVGGPPMKEKARFEMFVRTHANSTGIFDRVAAPLLRETVARVLPQHSNQLTQIVGAEEDEGTVRGWKDDPLYESLRTHPDLADPSLQDHIVRFRWGALIYEHIRNQWVHEAIESPDVAPPGWDTQIRYMNQTRGDENGRAVKCHPVVLPLPRLLEFYEEAIGSFERACLEQQIDPTPAR